MKQVFIADVMNGIAKFIMDSPLAADIQRPDLLQKWVDNSADSRRLSLEFSRKIDALHDADATLLVNVMECGDYEEDEGGNIWGQYKVFVQVSWPLYGNCDVVDAKVRIQLMAEVCKLAEAIEERFSEPIRQIVRTKAEREAREAAAETARHNDIAKAIVLDNCSGMRVGTHRRINHLLDIPEGHYDVVIGEKRFTLDNLRELGPRLKLRSYAEIKRTA